MIFLQILKIIGIVLLCLVGFILLLILLILFYPVTYRVELHSHEDFQGAAKAAYLFHIIRAKAAYSKDDGLSYSLKVLWFSIFSSEDDEEETPEKESELGQLLKDIDPEEEFKTEPQPRIEEHAPEAVEEKQEKGKKKKDKKAKHKKRKLPLKTRLTNLWNKIKKQYKKWKRILTDQRNKEAFAHFKKVLLKVLKAIMPYKLFLQASFSTGSPDTTAEVLGLAAMFPVGYKNRWKIYPDFESEKGYFDGDGDIRGRIFLFRIIFPALSILFDKKCMRLIRMVRK